MSAGADWAALGARMGEGHRRQRDGQRLSLSQHLPRFIEMATGVALTPALPEIAVAAERHKAMQIHRHEWSTIEGLTNLWLMHGLYGTHLRSSSNHPGGTEGHTSRGPRGPAQRHR